MCMSRSRVFINRALPGLLALLLLGQTLTACRRETPSVHETEFQGESVLDCTDREELLTISSDTVPEETDLLPPLVKPEEGLPYHALIITSYYATGKVAGKAMVGASFVELYNGAEIPLPLAGLSLYVSDKGGDFKEYRFSEGDTVPAQGFFLIRGREANGAHKEVLSVERFDTCFATLSPDPDSTRILLGQAGMTPLAELPLGELSGVLDYVTSHPLDAKDEMHYIESASVNKLIRRKASSRKTDFQSIHLGKASYTLLSQITPRTSQGKTNPQVVSQIPEVVFSHPSGVYAEGFDLTLTAPEGYTIYYSVNDTDPRLGVSMAYKTPLHLSDTTEMTWGKLITLSADLMGAAYDPLTATFPGAAVVRAFAVKEDDGSVTPLTTHTYLIGSVYTEWGVDMVSVSVNTGEFLGAGGIYNTLRTDPDGGHSHIPAYVEFFSPEGASVHAGWGEIAMNGRGSLSMTQKSFRILLKSHVMNTEEVRENLDTLSYDLYKEFAAHTPDGEKITWYRHILLRNGGGDMSGSTISRSHIGDAYIQRLDRILIPDVMAYAPVVTFINGEFWGMFNARDRMDPSYFWGKYGVSEEDFALLECPYPLTYGWNVDYTTTNGEPAEAEYFMSLVNFCMQNDMSVASNYDYIAQRVDLDGLIDQYCAQIYLCCSDWPSNNIKVWRNTNPNHPTMDTKWHFTIVDTDHGVGLNSTIHTNLWGVIHDGPVLSRMVNHLLQNKTFRERLMMRYIWCMEVAFSPQRMHAELDTLVERITPVMQYQLDRFRCLTGDRTSWDLWYSYIRSIHDFADQRFTPAKAQFMAWAGIDESHYRYLKQQALSKWGDKVA